MWKELCSFKDTIELPTNAYTAYKEIMFIVVTDTEVVGSITLPVSLISGLETGKYIYVNGWYCNSATNGMARLYVSDKSKKWFSVNKNIYGSYMNGSFTDFNVAAYGR